MIPHTIHQWLSARSVPVRRGMLCVAAIMLLLIAQQSQASGTWSPTLLVNTQPTQVIDDASAKDLSLQFGYTLNKTLTYQRATSRFQFNAPVYVQGTLGVTGTMSGNALFVQRAFSGAGLTGCSNATGDKLLWDGATQRFLCGTDQAGAGGASGLTQIDGDARYVRKSGGTMTGTLTIDKNGTNSGTGLVLREKAYLGSGAILSGSLILRSRRDPGASPADSLALFSKNIAGRMMLKGIGPSGLDYPYQPSIFNSNIAMYYPGNSSVIGTVNGWTLSTAGTISHPTIASTNLQTSMRRTRWASATTANAVGGIFTAQTNCWRGNAAGLGGFFFFARFSQAVSTNRARAFVGLSASTANVVAVEPSAALNMIGIGYDAADVPGNWRLMHNDGTGAATEVDLGSGAARNTSSVFDLFIFAPANSNTVTVRVVNQSTNTVVLDNYVISTDLPVSTTFLRIHAGGGPAASAVAQNFELNRLYLETDF